MPSAPSHANQTRRRLAVTVGVIGALAGVAIIALCWGTGWGWLGAALVSFSPMIAARAAAADGTGLRPALRRYGNRLAAIMVAYFAVLMFSVMAYKAGLASGPIGYLIAIAPAVPILGVFLTLGRFLKEESDEFLREVTLKSFVWSAALTLCEATIWGFLETFGKAPHVWMWVVPVAFFAQLGITVPLVARRYR